MEQEVLPLFRIGQGWDSHRIETGRPLILGGVTIPSEFGLAGHSDADVLFHAVPMLYWVRWRWAISACTFPIPRRSGKTPTSETFLRHTMELVAKHGYAIANVDSTIVLERPKLKDFRAAIRDNLARVLNLSARLCGYQI